MKTYEGNITELNKNQIFVFGSNTQGRHGLGSAKLAREKFGAIYGKSKGLQGNSYAIVTKDLTNKNPLKSISRDQIISQITELYEFARNNPELEFFVAYSGKGRNLNGYSPLEMSQMFAAPKDIPENIVFEVEFSKFINYHLSKL